MRHVTALILRAPMTTLAELGPRICIMGPSNSGKSTLASAIGRARGLPPIHLDQLSHLPGTDWVPRADADFMTLHDAAISGRHWVMEGNYSRYLPQRLTRATGFILLDTSTATSLLRYFRRSWFEHERHGGLDGAQDSVKWEVIHHIAVATRNNRRNYRALFNRISLPKISLPTTGEVARFYHSENLVRSTS